MTLDRFCAELRTAAGNPPEMARLEAALAVLATTDNAEVIEEYDHLVDIARRRLPLRTRVRAMLTMMEERQ